MFASVRLIKGLRLMKVCQNCMFVNDEHLFFSVIFAVVASPMHRWLQRQFSLCTGDVMNFKKNSLHHCKYGSPDPGNKASKCKGPFKQF